jgi:hypothetical protein
MLRSDTMAFSRSPRQSGGIAAGLPVGADCLQPLEVHLQLQSGHEPFFDSDARVVRLLQAALGCDSSLELSESVGRLLVDRESDRQSRGVIKAMRG